MKRLIDATCVLVCFFGAFVFYRMITTLGNYFDTHPVRFPSDLVILVVCLLVAGMIGIVPLIVLSLRGEDE